MTTPLATVNGFDLQRCELHQPQSGVPWADVVFGEPQNVTGSATLKFGSLSLVGTVDPRYSGAFAAARSARIVAGSGKWGAILPPRTYHADNGVSAQVVAADAARECGETLGEFVPGATKLGIDWSRAEGPASVTLEAAAGGVPWYVGLDGVTRVGLRAETPITGTYSLLTYSPRSRMAVLSVDEPASVQVGSIVSDRLAEPHVAREVVHELDSGEYRVHCWLGGTETSDCRLHDALTAAVERIMAGHLWGVYRYAVVSMADKRVRLRAVSPGAGVPDQIAVRERPGLPGCWAHWPRTRRRWSCSAAAAPPSRSWSVSWRWTRARSRPTCASAGRLRLRGRAIR